MITNFNDRPVSLTELRVAELGDTLLTEAVVEHCPSPHFTEDESGVVVLFTLAIASMCWFSGYLTGSRRRLPGWRQ